MPRQELRIVIGYIILAALWIVFSDRLLLRLSGENPGSLSLQSVKGLNFVFTTGVLLYIVLARSFNRHRRSEARERATSERFELIARAASDALWDWDLRTNEIWWSEGFQKLFGHSPEELEPTIESWTSRLHPEDRERTVGGIHRVIDGGGERWWDEYRFRRRDGTYADVFDRGYVIRDAAGQAVRMVGGITDVTRRKAAEHEILNSRQLLRDLSLRLESLREAEHTRISRQIHDELGQLLTGLKMDLRWIQRRLEAQTDPAFAPLLEKVMDAGELVDQCMRSVQDISAELRPAILDELGLPAALRNEAGRLQERTSIACTVQLPDPSPEVPAEQATVMFRITREALTNIVRHAGATAVTIALAEEPTAFLLTVTDNGRGIQTSELDDPKSLGLLGMKERAAPLGGQVGFAAGPGGRGTTVTLRLPRP